MTAGEKNGIEIAFHNSAALTWVLKGVEPLIPEATMTLDSKQIKLRGMDSSHVGLFDVHMHLDKLASNVSCADGQSFVIGFRTKAFKSFLSRFEKNALHLEYATSGNEDILTMYELNDSSVGSKRKQRNECQMKLLDIEVEELDVTSNDDWIEVNMDAGRWKKIVKAAAEINDDVISLLCTLEYFGYTSDGDNGNVSWNLYPEEDDITITTGRAEICSSMLKLSLKKLNEGCGKIDVKPGERMKLRIISGQLASFNYYLGDPNDPECTLVYYLAGRIDDQD